ncbi:MAG: 3-deoxy-8-phosphooctulonate synthase [Succinivibrionaceae bacterium]|nr:3-deoxy-8-phosphooctulonate synthase [Succinivibrionaceae bacterium]
MGEILVAGRRFANDAPLAVIGGVNVLESEDLALEVAGRMSEAAAALGMPYVFKGSFDKANRSSISSYRGPGLGRGLKILEAVRSILGVPVLTDVHEPFQAEEAAAVCDALQLPAFLARQTDLVTALARTGLPVNVKKPQFMSPRDLPNLIGKFHAAGNDQVMICERGTMFGYDNLVVDMLGLPVMKRCTGGAPVILDVTHALQCRDPGAAASGGRRALCLDLARAGVAVGIAGIFIEAHPNPAEARCDGPSALPLRLIGPFLERVAHVDALVKSDGGLEIS